MVIDAGRIKHLGDLMHKSIASNGSAVSSNWRLSADGLTNVVWTPETSGGGVSYGSNSNEVSYANASGASTLVSRTDHVHRGVTSLAHSSNTYSGPVVLETEGSLYIVRSAANTYRFGATSSAGAGGGGGSVTDYVSGNTGTGHITIPGLAGDGMRLPTSPNGSDLEFDATLSTGTAVGAATTEDANTFRPSNYYVKRNSTTTSLTGRYWAWSPSAGGLVTAKQTGFDATRAGNARSGLAVAAATPVAYRTWGIGWSTTYGIRVDSWTNVTTYSATPFNGTGYPAEGQVEVWLRIRYNSSTSIDFEYSWDGFLWHSALAAHNPGFTVGAAALIVDPESSDVYATWDYLRFS